MEEDFKRIIEANIQLEYIEEKEKKRNNNNHQHHDWGQYGYDYDYYKNK